MISQSPARIGGAEVGHVFVDATETAEAVQETPYKTGSPVSPAGHRIGVNSRYLTLDNEPWLPVMGEFHYSRYPESEWENEILKMKAGGVQIVSTYIIWIHHEEGEGNFDWTGQRDLHRFVSLCQRHGMYVYLRIGPWVHAEVRNGGLPDWLLQKGPTRVNDPAFLHDVDQFDRQIAQQVRGMMWKDGGPVIGIQLENEYAGKTGNREDAEHYILKLKQQAIDAGLDVPLYSVTAWDNAVVPSGAVLPVYGGYSDAPWDTTHDDLPASEVYAFRFSSRLSGNGAESRTAKALNGDPQEPYPFLTAEIGAGLEDTYGRRPVVSADDIAAMCPIFLGSGANLLGFYMYHGGENPDGLLSTLQESKATGSLTDLPVQSYDFQAPLSEFGEERESFRLLKLVTYFLKEFGNSLAPMAVHAPGKVPTNPDDLSVPRVAVRSLGNSGFIFVNNLVRHRRMPVWDNFQVTVKLDNETVTVPDAPISIPNGAYSIWPINLMMDGVRLRYSTAQPYTRLEGKDETDYVFFAIPGVRVDLSLAEGTFAAISGNVHSRSVSGSTLLENVAPGLATKIVLRTLNGKSIRIVVLSREEAENAWKTIIGEQDRLLFTSKQLFEDEGHINLLSDNDPNFSFSVFPGLIPALTGNSSIQRTKADTPVGVASFVATVPRVKVSLRISAVPNARPATSVNAGRGNPGHNQDPLIAPDADAFAKAPAWTISVHGYPNDELSELFLEVDYFGDAARLSSGGRLLTDNFFNGSAWVVGLKRFVKGGQDTLFEARILPFNPNALPKMEDNSQLTTEPNKSFAGLGKLTLKPQYQLVIRKPTSSPVGSSKK